MENKPLKRLDLIICLLVFVVAVSFPIDLFTSDHHIVYPVMIACRIAFVVFLYIFLKKNGAKGGYWMPKLTGLFFIPTLALCFCNPVYGWMHGTSVSSVDPSLLIYQTVLALATAFAEETLFRGVLHGFFPQKSKIWRVIVCAAIFGGMHLVNFLSTFNPIDLVTVVYTFGLGLVLGLMYEYGAGLLSTVLLHFLFNLCNTVYYENFIVGQWDFAFVMNAVIFSAAVGVYLLLIYLFVLKRKEE